MDIDVRFQRLDPCPKLRKFATQRIQAKLRRFSRELGGVVVRFADVNGPRGGPDKRCQITARGRRIGSANLHEVHSDPYAAAELALQRMRRTLARRTERLRVAS